MWFAESDSEKLSENNILISAFYLQKFTEEQKLECWYQRVVTDLLTPFLHKLGHVSWVPMWWYPFHQIAEAY